MESFNLWASLFRFKISIYFLSIIPFILRKKVKNIDEFEYN